MRVAFAFAGKIVHTECHFPFPFPMQIGHYLFLCGDGDGDGDYVEHFPLAAFQCGTLWLHLQQHWQRVPYNQCKQSRRDLAPKLKRRQDFQWSLPASLPTSLPPSLACVCVCVFVVVFLRETIKKLNRKLASHFVLKGKFNIIEVPASACCMHGRQGATQAGLERGECPAKCFQPVSQK